MKVNDLFEGKGYLTAQRDLMSKVRNEIAKALKLVRFRVVTYRQAEVGDTGVRWLIAAPLPSQVDTSDHGDVQFHLGMFQRLAKKEILKHFPAWKFVEADIREWEGKKTMMICVFYLPDANGALP